MTDRASMLLWVFLSRMRVCFSQHTGPTWGVRGPISPLIGSRMDLPGNSAVDNTLILLPSSEGWCEWQKRSEILAPNSKHASDTMQSPGDIPQEVLKATYEHDKHCPLTSFCKCSWASRNNATSCGKILMDPEHAENRDSTVGVWMPVFNVFCEGHCVASLPESF